MGELIEKTHSKGGTYWKEGAKSNHYGNLFVYPLLSMETIG